MSNTRSTTTTSATETTPLLEIVTNRVSYTQPNDGSDGIDSDIENLEIIEMSSDDDQEQEFDDNEDIYPGFINPNKLNTNIIVQEYLQRKNIDSTIAMTPTEKFALFSSAQIILAEAKKKLARKVDLTKRAEKIFFILISLGSFVASGVFAGLWGKNVFERDALLTSDNPFRFTNEDCDIPSNMTKLYQQYGHTYTFFSITGSRDSRGSWIWNMANIPDLSTCSLTENYYTANRDYPNDENGIELRHSITAGWFPGVLLNALSKLSNECLEHLYVFCLQSTFRASNPALTITFSVVAMLTMMLGVSGIFTDLFEQIITFTNDENKIMNEVFGEIMTDRSLKQKEINFYQQKIGMLWDNYFQSTYPDTTINEAVSYIFPKLGLPILQPIVESIMPNFKAKNYDFRLLAKLKLTDRKLSNIIKEEVPKHSI